MIIIITHWYVPMQDYEFEGKKVFQGIEDETGLILFQKKFFQNCLKHIVWPALRSPPPVVSAQLLNLDKTLLWYRVPQTNNSLLFKQ